MKYTGLNLRKDFPWDTLIIMALGVGVRSPELENELQTEHSQIHGRSLTSRSAPCKGKPREAEVRSWVWAWTSQDLTHPL